jgi:hypothetical protein
MAWTFDGSTYSGKDQVRLLVGDVDEDCPLIQDEIITGMLAVYPNEVETAAHLCASLAAQFAAEGDLKVDGYDFQNVNRAKFFRDRSMDLFRQVTGSSFAVPLSGISAGGISKATRDSNRENLDNIEPSFYRGQFRDNRSSNWNDDEDC